LRKGGKSAGGKGSDRDPPCAKPIGVIGKRRTERTAPKQTKMKRNGREIGKKKNVEKL